MLIYLVAGEASGDAIGARLIIALRRLRPDLEFAGIGGPRMAEQGLASLFPMHELALMGLVEVLPKIRHISRRMTQTIADIVARHPAIVVTIDSPGFTLRLLRRIAPLGIRRVHYVGPQVWAWRQGRVKHFPGLWDELLCLLPFEPAFFAKHHLPARFVGHPVLESGADTGNGPRFRAAHAIAPDARVLVIMPGSRRSEITRLLPIFGTVLQSLPGIIPVVIAAPAVADTVIAAAATWPTPPIVVQSLADKHDAFAAARAALTKSGTSTLELATAGVPMLVTYRVNPITAAIVRRLVKIKYASLLNLIAEREIVPELIQDHCTPNRILALLQPLLNGGPEADTQRQAFPAILSQLRAGHENPSDVAASIVLDTATKR